MKILRKTITRLGLITGLSVGLYAGAVSAATLDLANSPLFLTTPVKPAVMVMLDNSGSMKAGMYNTGFNSLKTGFDPTKDYYGIFDFNKNYEYDATIPVNTGAYNVSIDPSVQGAFVESNCTPSSSDFTCWDGAFLNWITTRRIDSTRMVLVGGKLESRTAYDYDGNGDADAGYSYKILGNNEPSDRTLVRGYSNSSGFSPVPDNVTITMSSPADNGNVKSTYKPYAVLTGVGGSVSANTLYTDGGSQIGEFGTISATHSWVTVNYQNSYSSTPIIIAKPPSYNGSDPSVVRIRNVSTSSFEIRIQEPEYKDGNHTTETIPYLVVKAGSHTLNGGTKLKAGTVNTGKDQVSNDCGHGQNQSKTVNFSGSFSSTPVVLTSVQTFSDATAVNSRGWNISTGGFKVALQEEEKGTSGSTNHGSETIGYVAVEPGLVTDTDNATSFTLIAGTQNNVDENLDTINYSSASFSNAPTFLAAIQSMNDNDTAALRLDNNSNVAAQLFVEEEKSCESEVNHSNEEVGYIALEGKGLELNVALAIEDESTGLLQDVKDDVQLGISFYTYDTSVNDIYNGNKIDGGTLKFNIPKNPFVDKPSNTALPTAERGYYQLTGYTGTDIADIVDAIENYPLVWGTTPIAENLWEVIQYFEQDTPHYSSNNFDLADNVNPERDPYYSVEYSRNLMCVRGKVLIFTDGEPYRDAGLPSLLNNYDRDGSNETASTTANASDPKSDIGILDDTAYWAYCDDDAGNASCAGLTLGTRDLRIDSGMDGDQFLTIDTVGFADGDIRPTLQDTADNAGGTAYAAEDGIALATALKESFAAAISIGASSSVAANSTRLDTNTLIYQALFDSSDWSGRVKAYAVDSTDGSIDTNSTPVWDTDTAGVIPAYGSRNIFSRSPASGGTGIVFAWGNLDATQQVTLRDGAETDDVNAEKRVNYILGNQADEEQNGGIFRDRSKLLGDIIHSNPWFVGSEDFGLTSVASGGGVTYTNFRTSIASRSKVLYVGANDGMLHALDATTGEELFAYVPSPVIPQLKELTDPEYGRSVAHMNYVDGSPRAGDVYFSGAWHTLLAGTLGTGGRGVYALDVTDPDNFAASDVLWEFTNTSTDGADLGYTLGEPTVALTANGAGDAAEWAVIVGNGYNSDNGHAVLYVLSAEDGDVIKKIDTLSGSVANPNGLGTPIAIDVNGDKIVDSVYAGDLLGNMWKFDLTDDTASNWSVSFGTNPLFIATDANGNTQPITAKPQVGLHPDGGVMVYFGTGKYIETADNIVGNSPQVQTFYGIRDNYSNGTSLPVNYRTDLVEQEILAEGTVLTFDARVTSNNEVDYSSKVGWYMELESPVNGAEGERVINQALLRGNALLFTTLIPSSDPCETGGTGWLMELEGYTGERQTASPFDISGDGSFTVDDEAQLVDTNNDNTVDSDDDTLIITGLKSTIGIIQSPNVISGGQVEYLNFQGSSGDVGQVTRNASSNNGRQAWRQLR